TRLTHAQFLAEQPDALIPPGHVDANGILKISVTASGSYRVRGRNLGPIPFSGIRNITQRFYMPPDQAGRYFSNSPLNQIITFFSTDTYPTLTNTYQKACNWRPDAGTMSAVPGNFHATI